MDPGGPTQAPVADQTVERYADLARRLLDRPPRLGATRLVAVDGPSGAGKTVFADRLAAAIPGTAVLHTDDLLDGWDDQFTFWPRLQEWVLAPLRVGRSGRYRRYDWHRGRFSAGWLAVPPPAVLILEGVSTARASITAELTYAVFVTAPDPLRRRRAVERDGAAILPYLDVWRRAEHLHFTTDDTAARADLLVNGAPRIAHDPHTEYVRLR